MKRTTPTIRDVAKAANVSIATVSKYLNGAQRFSQLVETAIDTAVAQLGYRTNEVARSMISGQTKAIGVAILDINNPHFTAVVKGANRVAIEAGYTLLLVDTEENQGRELQLLDTLSRRVDGLIISSRMPETQLQTVINYGKPAVIFGRFETLQASCVGIDGYNGSFMLAEHLVSQGNRKIAYLGFSKSRWDRDRQSGAEDYLKLHGLSLRCLDAEEPFASEGERLCAQIMAAENRPEALICYNDLLAIGFMKKAKSLGFNIPEDISVAGVDNIPYSNYVSPSLTSIDIQSEGMGEVAMRKMLNLLADKPVEPYTVLPSHLVVRCSTGIKR